MIEDRRTIYLISLISPIIGGYLAIRKLTWHQRRPILVFLVTLYGATIVLETSDGYVLQQMIHDHYVNLSFDQWYFELKEILLFSPEPGTKGDVFSHVFSYIFGEILGIPGLYFAFVSSIYGYFFILSLSKILRWDDRRHTTVLFWGLVLAFVSYRFIDELQSVRTWTGLWVLFYGVYSLYETGRLRYILMIFAAPLFHFAYFLIVIPVLIVFICRPVNASIYILAYFLSFFLQVNEQGIVRQLKVTDLGQEKVEGYYKEDKSEYWDPMDEANANWYKKYGRGWALPNAPHVVAFSLILIGVFSKHRMTSLEFRLFATGILLATFANIFEFIPPFYVRTMINGGVYILAVMVMLLLRGELLNATGPRLVFRKAMLWISILSLSPYMVYVLSNMLQFTSVFMIISPIMGFFAELNLSIRDFLGLFM